MTTAIDTNVIVAVWDAEDSLHRIARAMLDTAFNESMLVISGAVYAELLAAPGRTEQFLNQFCEDAQIEVEWELVPNVWKAREQLFSAMRRDGRGRKARRILADFVIGAHATVSGY